MATFNFLSTQQTCDDSWDTFFNRQDIRIGLSHIELMIDNRVEPQSGNIFKVFKTDLTNCKVVILGQDPYPQPNVATGRAFEVGGINSWNAHINASLRNIIKLLHNNKFGINRLLPPVSIKTVRNDIISEKFIILPPNLLFDSWERQGVLLLNTALTCPQPSSSNPKTHKTLWKFFTEEVIKFIDSRCENNISWFLWGNNAKNFDYLILNNGNKYYSDHPRLNSNNSGSFFFENHFSKILSVNWY